MKTSATILVAALISLLFFLAPNQQAQESARPQGLYPALQKKLDAFDVRKGWTSYEPGLL